MPSKDKTLTELAIEAYERDRKSGYGTSVAEQTLEYRRELNRLVVEEPEAYQAAVADRVARKMEARAAYDSVMAGEDDAE